VPEDFVCPLAAKEVEPEPEPVVEPGKMDDGDININGFKISGIRTYSIILLIVLMYGFLAIRSDDVQGMQNLALIAAGFLFGFKAMPKK
jgi:hypothetical protein